MKNDTNNSPNKDFQEPMPQSEERPTLGGWQIILKDKNNIAPGSHKWSEETFRIFGYQLDEVEVSIDLFFSHIHRRDLRMVEEAFRGAIKKCSDYDLKYRMVGKDRTEMMVHMLGQCEHYLGCAEWVKFTGTIQDITTGRSARKYEFSLNSIFQHPQPSPGTNATAHTADDVLGVQETVLQKANTTAGPGTRGTLEKRPLKSAAIRTSEKEDDAPGKIYLPELSERLNQVRRHLMETQRIAHIGSWQIILKDIENSIPGSLQWSDEAFRIFGYKPNEVTLTGRLFFNRIHPDDLGAVEEAFGKAISTRSAYDIEHRIIRKDGSVAIVHAMGECYNYGGSDQWVKITGTFQDISARKKAERYEAGLRSIFDNTEMAYYLLDADLHIVSFNQAALDHTKKEMGLELKEGRSMMDFIIPDRKKMIRKLFTSIVKGGKETYELDFSSENGSGHWYQVTLFPVVLNNRDMGMVMSLEEITDRKRSEEIIRAKEAKYHSFFEHSMDALLMQENSGKIYSANPAACALFRMTEQEICAAGRDGITDQNHPNLQPLLEQRRHTGSARGELSFLRKDGSSFPASISSVAYCDVDGEDRVNVIIHDLTEKKIAEEAREQKHRDLRSHMAHLHTVREEERGVIAREIHDELGQQLTTLKMGVHGVLRKLESNDLLDDITSGMLGEIDKAIQSVKRIASNLRPIILDYEGIVAALKWYASEFEKQHEISCSIRADLPLDIEDKEISIALFRIFQESLTNIVRHANADRIEVEIKMPEGEIILSIADNGIGINHTDLEQKRTFGIAGMKERATLLGGQYSIGSNKPRGTITEVVVPYTVASCAL